MHLHSDHSSGCLFALLFIVGDITIPKLYWSLLVGDFSIKVHGALYSNSDYLVKSRIIDILITPTVFPFYVK